MVRQRAAMLAAFLGLFAIFAGLIIGLRDAPASLFTEPTVAAASVFGRALVALGLLATGVTLIRTAERLYFPTASE
ncbi:MAG: hypothetical protein ABSC94_07760 [Polyangiaceae bacterium]|jgi:hypothetical protein